jgi:probable phosphoglycerate mutase
LVINQVNGSWRVSSSHLRELWSRAQQLKTQFGRCTLTWVKRDKNKKADALSSAAIVGERGDRAENGGMRAAFM